MPKVSSHRRPGRTPAGVLIFFTGFLLLLLVVSKWYLLPALAAARNAQGEEKKILAANARLVLAVVLFVLLAGMVLTFRASRFLFPRPGSTARPRTKYVDAWAESARRIETPPRDE